MKEFTIALSSQTIFDFSPRTHQHEKQQNIPTHKHNRVRAVRISKARILFICFIIIILLLFFFCSTQHRKKGKPKCLYMCVCVCLLSAHSPLTKRLIKRRVYTSC